MGLRRPVEILVMPGGDSPLAAGWRHLRIFLPADFLRRLDRAQLEALLAHELAHLARRDPLWSLLSYLVCRLFFFQPLNLLARRRLQMEAEYLADSHAAAVLADGVGLARCLVTLTDWRGPRRQRLAMPAAVGMAPYRSQLGQRVRRILEEKPGAARTRGGLWIGLFAALTVAILFLGPRALARPQSFANQTLQGETTMSSANVKQAVGTLAVALGLALPLEAAEEEKKADSPPAATTIDKAPEGMHGFSGTLVGTLVSSDPEKGSLVLKVQRVKNVWKGNKAPNPKSGVGKTLQIDGVFGKFLDVLLILKPGDGVEIETKHVKGDALNFLGENLRKVALEQPRGEDDKPRPDGEGRGGLDGFRGILAGKVVKTDPEKGVLVFKMEEVKKVWRQNKARNPQASIGKELVVEGIAGKFLDVLLVLKKGDTVEVEAFHVGGEALRFPGEWLKKVE
jgi:hypothetical protein